MDKWMDNPWFIKVLALVLAVLLYSSITNTSDKATDEYVPGGSTTETIKDIPVKVYYDTKNLVITGVPDTVDVTIKGPITHVQTAKALKNFEVAVDLTDAKIGRQKAKMEVRNLSDKIKATIKPASVTVTIEEKITQEFNVEAEYNSDLIGQGFSAGKPVVEPKKVKVTGAKSAIDRITYVKAVVDQRDRFNETTTREASVQVLDKGLNKLNVQVEPATVKVTIPIKENSKTVPINIVRKGTPPEGVTIQSIDLETTEAVITADEDVLKNTESVRVEVDVSEITANTTLDLPVIISNGVTKVSPQMVKVNVKVNSQAEKTVSGVPVKIKGLSAEYKADIDDPANDLINLVINGPSGTVNALGPSDFNVYVDLSNLEAGSHDVNIHVEGPANINWKLDKATAKVTITNNA
jgi:YbbR domain-containing protein